MAIIDFLNKPFESTQKEEVGIGGFTAMVRVSESTSLTSTAPTTFLEDGSFANDHIVINPTVLTIDGDVSEIHIRRSALNEFLANVQANVGAIALYLPPKTQSQVQKANALANDFTDQVRKVDAAVAAGKQALSFLGNQTPGGKPLQEKFIDAMESLHFGRQLVSIDMPYRRHDNMRITAVQTTRDNKGQNIKFKLTAEQIRFAETIFVDQSEFISNPSEGTGGQTDGVTDKGPQAGEPTEQSLLFGLLGT